MVYRQIFLKKGEQNMSIEQILKLQGFESAAEFHTMIADVDISTIEKMASFKEWQDKDGTKTGLLKLKGEVK